MTTTWAASPTLTAATLDGRRGLTLANPSRQHPPPYITSRILCMTLVMYFSKNHFWMSIMSSSRPWM